MSAASPPVGPNDPQQTGEGARTAASATAQAGASEGPKPTERSEDHRTKERISGNAKRKDASPAWKLAGLLFGADKELFKGGRSSNPQGFGHLLEQWVDVLTPSEKGVLAASLDSSTGKDDFDFASFVDELAADFNKPINWNVKGVRDFVAERFSADDRVRDVLMRIAPLAGLSPDRADWQARLMECLAVVRAADEQGDGNREHATDSLIDVLRRVRGMTASDGQRYREFIDTLHRLLRQDPYAELSVGRLQSLSALGDRAGSIKQAPYLLFAVAIYEYSLSLLCQFAQLASTSERWRRARIAANNISGHLSSTNAFDAGVPEQLGGDKLTVVRLMNRMQVISVLGNELGADAAGTTTLAEDWERFGLPLNGLASEGRHGDVYRSAATFVRAMNNVVSGWAYLEPAIFEAPLGNVWPQSGYLGERFSLLMACLGAVLRCRHAETARTDADEPGTTLFNAGLSVSRLRRTVTHSNDRFRAVEMILYGAGLYWALQGRGQTLAQAMQELHGDACLVNLTSGATELTQMRPKHPALEAALRLLPGLVAAMVDADLIVGVQRQRVENSVKELMEFDLATGHRPQRFTGAGDMAQIRRYLSQLLDALAAVVWGSDHGLPAAASWDAGFTVSVTPWVRHCCEWVLNQGATGYSFDQTLGQMRAVLTVLLGLTQRADALEELVGVQPSKPGPSILRTTLEAMAGEPGRLWRMAFASLSVNKPQTEQDELPQNYVDWLAQPGVLAWLASVQLKPTSG